MLELSASKINREIENIKSRYEQKYGAVIFDVKIENISGSVMLTGLVLSEKQKKEIFLTVNTIVGVNKIKNKIKVLVDPNEKLEVGWGVVSSEIAEIWSDFPDKKNITGKILASQALKNDFLRILFKKGDWFLVQTDDLTVGWMNFSLLDFDKSKQDTIRKLWLKTKRVNPGEVVKKRLAKNIQAKFFSFLKKYLNVQYLLGGATEGGIDCSGLTQRFYSDVFGIILPRHSSNQAFCGKDIKLNVVCFGDLVFFRHKITKFAHVGIVVEKFEKTKISRQDFGNVLILNTRKEKGLAIIEDLPEILKSYNLISIKRIIKGF